MRPKLSENVDLSTFTADIQREKKNLQIRNNLFRAEGSAVIGFMNLYWLFKNSPYVLQRKRLTIDAATIASTLTIAEVDNVKSGLDTLMERQYLSVGDFGIIGNIETGGYTFFTIDGRSGMKEGSLNALMTLNPTDINSMYQLPGFEALFHSNKKSAGKNCALKQSGPVWFLTGTFGGSATRTCAIPAEKAIMLSLINAECDYLAKPNLKTEQQLLACAKSENEGITGLDATVDGIKTQGLQNYRVQSPLFNFTYPNNNVNGAPAGSTQGVSDGYWIILKPLPIGDHTVHFGGSVVNYAGGALNNFANDVTYHLKVQ
jgi:hypothetical protein